MQKPTRPLLSKFRPQLLKSHQFQGKLNDCGPFAAAIIMNAILNLDLNGTNLALGMNHIRWHGLLPVIRRIPKWATFPWGVVDVLRENGLSANWKCCGQTSNLFANLLEDKITIVIVGEWKPLWAHYLVLVEYHPEKGFGFVDTAIPSGLVVWKRVYDFHRLWKNYGNLFITVSTTVTPK